jgi:hypothetical protein
MGAGTSTLTAARGRCDVGEGGSGGGGCAAAAAIAPACSPRASAVAAIAAASPYPFPPLPLPQGTGGSTGGTWVGARGRGGERPYSSGVTVHGFEGFLPVPQRLARAPRLPYAGCASPHTPSLSFTSRFARIDLALPRV